MALAATYNASLAVTTGTNPLGALPMCPMDVPGLPQQTNTACLKVFQETFKGEETPALRSVIERLYNTPVTDWDEGFNALFQDALYRSDTFTSRFFEERTAFGKVVQNFWNSSYTVDCDTIAEAEVEAKALAEKLSSLQCRAKKVAKPEAGVLDKISGFFRNFLSPLPAEGKPIKDKNQIIPDQHAKLNKLYSYTIPKETFEGNVTLSAQRKTGLSLPKWLSFFSSNWTFQGTPKERKSHNIEVKATHDETGLEESTFFDLEAGSDPDETWTVVGTLIGVVAIFCFVLWAREKGENKVNPSY